MDSEEFPQFEEHHRSLKYLGVRPGFPKGQKPSLTDLEIIRAQNPTAQVRITDLRLAKELRPLDLERELKQVLPSLQLPVTKDNITRWKWDTLKEPAATDKFSRRTEVRDEGKHTKVVATSFAAAALLLIHDLAMRNLEEAGYDDLEEYIGGLAEIVNELIDNLYRSTSKLENLLAQRPSTGSRDPGAKHYTALVLYRMGRDLKAVASRIGINPRSERNGEPVGSKNWRTLLLSSIQRGIEVEREKFYLATAVFAHRSDERVQSKAVDVYHDYCCTFNELQSTHHLDWMDEGDDLLNIPTNEGEEIYRAHVQLGSCLTKGIDPFPTTLT